MADIGEPKEKNTILELSEEIGSMLTNLRDILDNRFYRVVEHREENDEIGEVIPNVLDEITQNLEADKAKLSDIMRIISSQVLPKIN